MIKVLIVDDSALIRRLLVTILSSDDDIEVVGTAHDPYEAREKIKALRPDVITLDVEMPKMDGLTFLGNLMRLHPLPVVMVSTFTTLGADMALKAIELGAVDYIRKPALNARSEMKAYSDEINTKVKTAARATIKTLSAGTPESSGLARIEYKTKASRTDFIIAIGASTGGTEAIKNILRQLPSSTPPIVISQHIPIAFSQALADRLDLNSDMSVRQASHGDRILPGHAYLAPGDQHLLVKRQGTRFICHLDGGEPVNRHKPSVEVMFNSVATSLGANSVGVLLTGMGSDGSEAMGTMKAAGASTIAQDKKTSVVWGMPGEAVKRGYADDVLPLHGIAEKILKYAADKR